MNESGLEPRGRAVLVEHYEPEKKDSVIVLPDQVSSRQMMVEQRAVVIAIGPACWPDEPPRAKVGEKVMISAMAGYMTKGPADDKVYRLVRDNDIFAAITKEKS